MGFIIDRFVPELIHILEFMGIFVICVSALRAFIIYIKSLFKPVGYNIRLMLGRSLELGLEYKMGAEILKTVLIRDMSEIWILASIIILRSLLSVLLYFEIRSETDRSSAHEKKSE